MIDTIKSSFDLRIKQESLTRIVTCLDMLTEDQVWYRPNDNSNSIGNLILHLSGNITQYIQHGIAGKKDIRSRDEEFSIIDSEIKKAQLKSIISETIYSACNIVNELSEEDLLHNKRVQVFDLNVLEIIIHVIEHSSYHVGQITYITKMLTDKPTGYYEGMEL